MTGDSSRPPAAEDDVTGPQPQGASPEVQALFDTASAGEAARLAVLLDADPSRRDVRLPPYRWTLLHAAAQRGHLPVVELLLARGLDPHTLEDGDRTSALHWAASAGHVDVVRRLLAAGIDPVGSGDDHELEVIGWATCWDGCDDDAHRAVVDLLLAAGARHHVFSAIAVDDADEVRRIVAADPSQLARPMSRNEGRQLPLHFAVGRGRARLAALLLELGADPLAVDDAGHPAAACATTPDADRAVMAAVRGRGAMDLLAALALRDWDDAARRYPGAGPIDAGALHLAAKRGDVDAVRWLLDRGAEPSARWAHWGAEVTPLHLAALQGHAGVARLLLAAGADTTLRDTAHDGDPLGWAEHCGRTEVAELLRAHAAPS
jgi:ankyrin repeat protein